MVNDAPGSIRYVPNKRWALRDEGRLLVLSAGADELYAIEDAAPATVAEIVQAWDSGTIDPRALSADGKDAFRQLLSAGIVRPDLHAISEWKTVFRFVHDTSLEPALCDAVDQSSVLTIAKPDDCDLIVFVRTDGRLGELYEATDRPSQPHLFLDVGYDHTVSLGPLVFPGDTACLGCLAGRIGHYWGDAPPPSKAGVLRNHVLIASLLALEVEKIAAGDIGLINATVSWDLRGWEIQRNAVYKLPWCPHCGDPDPPEPMGSIAWPWIRS